MSKRDCLNVCLSLIAVLFSMTAIAGEEGMGEKEIPDGCFYFSSQPTGRFVGISERIRRNDEASAFLKPPTGKGAFAGLGQEIEIGADTTVTADLFLIADTADPLQGAVLNFCIEWKTEDNQEIKRDCVSRMAREVSRIRWEQLSVKGTVPENAVRAVVTITCQNPDGAATGLCYLHGFQVSGAD